MTIGGGDFTEPLINGELNPSPILVSAENYIAVTRPLSDGHANNPVSHDPYEKGDASRWVWGEIREQCWLAGPIIMMYTLQYIMALAGIIFVGHLGAFPLAAVSLSNSFSAITGFNVMMGLGNALETLCGQAYGAKQYHLLGIYLQRAMAILAVVALLISLVWLNMGRILVAAGEDPNIAQAAQSYILWLLPCLFVYAMLMPMIKFFQMQRAVYELMLCTAATVILHVFLCWFIIDRMNVGYKGAAVAGDISLLFQLGLLLAFVRFSSKFEKTFTSFSMDALQDFGEFFRLAIPSASMLCLEHWSYEILILLAGLLPNSKLNISSVAICIGLLSLVNMIAIALAVATSVRVSHELGAGKANAARSAVAVAVGLGLVEGIAMGCLIYSLRNTWGWAFSSDQEVVDQVAHTAPYLAMLAAIYGSQAILTGVVRGIGWQRLGAFANLGAYYVVGLPVALIAVFGFHLDSRGLWLGMGCGLVTQLVALMIVILFANWEKLAREALLRSNTYTSRLPTTATLLPKPVKEEDMLST